MAAPSPPKDPSSPLAYSTAQTALILLDFQGFVINLCAGGVAATSRAAAARKWALSRGIAVIHSLVDHAGTAPIQNKNGPRIKNMLASIADDPQAISSPVELAFSNEPREFLTLKRPGVVSGLKSEESRKLLKDEGLESLIICGLSTSGAVLSTTLPAVDDGFVVSVLEDACADRTAEWHEKLVENVLKNRAHVSTVEDFISQWNNAKGKDP